MQTIISKTATRVTEEWGLNTELGLFESDVHVKLVQ